MKFSFALVLALSLSPWASSAPAPRHNSAELARDGSHVPRSLLTRSVEVALEDFLEARVTNLTPLNNGEKKAVIAHVKNNRAAVQSAATAGDSAHSYYRPGDTYRIDRQNGNGNTGKIAVQTNGRNSVTVAQVAVKKSDPHDRWAPGAGRVSRGLIRSAKTGREVTIQKKGPTQAQLNAQAAKAQRNRDKKAAGDARAAQGIFRKGNVPGSATKKFTPINNWPKRTEPAPPKAGGGKAGKRK